MPENDKIQEAYEKIITEEVTMKDCNEMKKKGQKILADSILRINRFKKELNQFTKKTGNTNMLDKASVSIDGAVMGLQTAYDDIVEGVNQVIVDL